MSEDEEWHDASSKTCLVCKRSLFFSIIGDAQKTKKINKLEICVSHEA